MAMTFDDLKGTWRHRKTGKYVDVVSMNTRDDTLGLRHESGRQSDKAVHYFIQEYARPPKSPPIEASIDAERRQTCPHGVVRCDYCSGATLAATPSLSEVEAEQKARETVADWDATVINAGRPAVITTDSIHDLIKRISKALQSVPVTRSEWQPIETAPKTGETILLGHSNSVWEDEWYSPETQWWQTVIGNVRAGEVPSHWMPLPSPPVTKEPK